MTLANSGEEKMHIGRCHCGNVTLTIPHLTDSATRCNCSICSRYSAVWGYFEEAEVTITVGKYGVSGYSYGDKTISFVGCDQCHCLTHYTSLKSAAGTRLAVNYRMFDAGLLAGMQIRYFDGAKSWQDMAKKDWVQDG